MRTSRTLGTIIALAMLLIALPLSAGNQTGKPQRVKFGHGRTTAVLKGTVKPGVQKTYVLKASSGQTMSVHITSRDHAVTFLLDPPSQNMVAGPVEDWSGKLKENGDYEITVGTKTAKPQQYTLEVTIR